jgi:hypothetical protein
MKKFIVRAVICVIISAVIVIAGYLDANPDDLDSYSTVSPLYSMIAGTLFFTVIFFTLSLALFFPTDDEEE